MREENTALVEECKRIAEVGIDFDEIEDMQKYFHSLNEEEQEVFAFALASTGKMYREGFFAVAKDISIATTDEHVDELRPKLDTMTMFISIFEYLMTFFMVGDPASEEMAKKFGLSPREQCLQKARAQYEHYVKANVKA